MQIREMKESDIGFAFQCTRREGWASETEDSFLSFLEHDPRGCFVAEIGGMPIGICVAIAYEKNGFVGELIVIEEERGRGYGKALFQHTLDFLGTRSSENIYLDGELKAVPIYEKSGFRKICRSLRFLGQVKSLDHPAVIRAEAEDVEKVCQIDKTFFGDDRGFFIRRCHRQHSNLFFILKGGEQIKGYIMARPGVEVISVGPYALVETDEDPLVLLRRLALEVPHQPLRFGVLETNTNAVEIIRSSGEFEEQIPCWRMVLGPADDLGADAHLIAVGSAAKG